GVPDDRVGEELCAWIKLKDPKKALTAEEVRSFCKNKITYFKIPKYILFVDDFPMTNTRKVKKFEMTEKSCEILGLSQRK
ncbi:fatty acid--CoA ligase-like protein, partial [Leptotrombidium deliense]